MNDGEMNSVAMVKETIPNIPNNEFLSGTNFDRYLTR